MPLLASCHLDNRLYDCDFLFIESPLRYVCYDFAEFGACYRGVTLGVRRCWFVRVCVRVTEAAVRRCFTTLSQKQVETYYRRRPAE
jgi:hypothetical protein